MTENQNRALKIGMEKSKLEMQTSKGSENLMSESVYKMVVKNIAEIKMVCDKKRGKSTNQPDPTSQLVEIETHINRILKFLQLAKIAENDTVVAKMKVL